MKSFLRTLLAVIVVDILIVGILAIVIVSALDDEPEVKSGTVLVQTISGPILEYSPPSSGIPMISDEPVTHTAILENLEKARYDDRIAAVLLKLAYPQLGSAKTNELRDRIGQLRQSGKPVWAYTEYLNGRTLLIGGACDNFYLLPGGYVTLRGMGGGMPFIKGTLEKLGIEENLHRIENYKTAAETIQRENMSPESRENFEWILDEFYPAMTQAIESDRGLASGSLEADVLSMGAMVPNDALEAKLVDELAYLDEVEAALLRLEGVEEAKKKSDGAFPRPRRISGCEYAKVSRKDAGIKAKHTIAVVHAQGTITGEKSGVSPLLGMTMGAATMESAFRQAVANEDVEAIIYRIDSGGGESSTSWRIGRAAERADDAKPMVVSMCDVAGSGGYMIAHPCSTLIAERLSIVGSIGSITGKFNMRGFYNKLGITMDFVTRGPHALMGSDYSNYTPEEYAALAERHWMDYWDWVEDIARERNMTPAEVDSSGRGRVFTGQQALDRRLIDQVGGFDVAVQIAKEKAGIPEDEQVEFIHYPKKQGPLEALKSGSFGAFLHAMLREVFAPFEREATWAVDLNSYW
jgi:protease-4